MLLVLTQPLCSSLSYFTYLETACGPDLVGNFYVSHFCRHLTADHSSFQDAQSLSHSLSEEGCQASQRVWLKGHSA
eukprot:5413605-Amphidinium_carterae.1